MKTRIISKTVFVLFAFMFIGSSSSVFGQQGRNFANNQRGNYLTCVNQLPDLTPDQTTKITELVQSHQSEMQALRTERRATRTVAQKDAIRVEMDELVYAHRDEVRALLSDEQKSVYDHLNDNYLSGNKRVSPANSRRGNNRRGRGNATMRGNRGFRNGRGYGRC